MDITFAPDEALRGLGAPPATGRWLCSPAAISLAAGAGRGLDAAAELALVLVSSCKNRILKHSRNCMNMKMLTMRCWDTWTST